MTAALRAEWVKLRTLGETWWLAAGMIALSIAASAAMAATTHVSRAAPNAGADPARLALTGIDLGQAVVAIVAVIAITDEYGTGLIQVSLVAIPRRRVMLAAKLLNIVGLVLVAAIPAVGGCLVTGRMLLPGAGLDPAHGYALVSIAHGSTLRAACGALLYLACIALLSVGIGTIVRETAVAVGAALGLLYLPPLLALLVSGPWRRHIEQIAPMTAGLSVESTQRLRSLPIGPWVGLGVLAAWAAGALLVGSVLLCVRDA